MILSGLNVSSFLGLIVALRKYGCTISHLDLAVLPYTYILLACASAFSLNPYTYFQAQAHLVTKVELELRHPTHVPTPLASILHPVPSPSCLTKKINTCS